MGTNAITTVLSLLEIGKRMYGGKFLPLAQNLIQRNQFLQDAAWIEANNGTFHKHLKMLSLPSASWRGANEGVTVQSGQTSLVDEPVYRCEIQNPIDEAAFQGLADKEGMRRMEDSMALEGLGQAINDGVLYGTGTKGTLNGLASRFYDSGTLHTANVLNNGATTGNCTSIFVVEWGESGLYLAYSPGLPAGIQVQDMGLERVLDSNSKPYFAWITRMAAHIGLCIRDDRAVQRIRNIKVADTKANKGLDDDNIIRALRRLPNMGNAPGTRIYCGRDAKTQMDLLAKNQTNILYGFKEYGGQPMTTFQGVPIGLQEKIKETEAYTVTTPF